MPRSDYKLTILRSLCAISHCKKRCPSSHRPLLTADSIRATLFPDQGHSLALELHLHLQPRSRHRPPSHLRLHLSPLRVPLSHPVRAHPHPHQQAARNRLLAQLRSMVCPIRKYYICLHRLMIRFQVNVVATAGLFVVSNKRRLHRRTDLYDSFANRAQPHAHQEHARSRTVSLVRTFDISSNSC